MAAELVGRLQGVTKTASGWEARCPAHDDATASLSVAEGRKGIVLHCHAGCTADAVCRALGRSTADLFADNGNGNGKPAHRQITFDWNRCVEAYKSDHCRKLGEWRGLSQKFVKWLHLLSAAPLLTRPARWASFTS